VPAAHSRKEIVRMPASYRVLSLGASYGSLLAIKMVAAGHDVTLACLPAEAEAFNRDGARVRMPVKGREGLFEIDSRTLPGKLSAAPPDRIDGAGYDLVVLAMQEPQYRSPGVRELVAAIARARIPCMSIMNMPPLPYLARIPGIDLAACRPCYTDASVWDGCDPKLMTLCSPDPQAFRPPDQPVNLLQVRLPTNFKSARFDGDAPTRMLEDIAAGIEAARFDVDGVRTALPVKLKVHESVFVPLAKWAMLLAGNYRCVGKDAMIPIRDAVHADLAASRAVYDWVVKLCVALGASHDDMVPFDKYANAALSLASPSSAARALANGARDIERIDQLVKVLGTQKGMRSEAVDAIVARVDDWIARNRRAA